jgi:hypothetical protein
MVVNHILYLQHRTYGEKKLSQIYMSDISVDIYNTNKSLI